MRTIFFVPRYIASLKYYERLFPLVRSLGREPSLVLFEDLGMRAYAEEKGLPYQILSEASGRLPFVSHIRAFNRLRTRVRALLARERDALFITEGRLPDTMKMLVHEARKAGVQVAALQWCMHSSHTEHQKRSLLRALQKMRGRDGSLVRGIPRAIYFSLLRGVFRLFDAVTHERYVYSELPERIGVFDQYSRGYFRAHGYSDESIEVVGNFDAERAREIAHTLTPEKRAAQRAAYGLPTDKPCILLLSTIFYAGNMSVCMSKEENIAYYRSLIADIRVAYGAHATILFKLHPREFADAPHYADVAQVVTLEHDAEDLARIADLYIAHPVSIVNMTARATHTPSLIINFTPLRYMDDFAPAYGIRHIITDRAEFRSALIDAARGGADSAFEPDVEAGDFSSRLKAFLRA